ncbi:MULTISPECIES: hypothetical protein [unclassified Streptomyces]|uniref:hypothetical protein n=1 Tax=unclassified Streptomyces TaxID=2593676 RepID=UPI002E170FC0
MADVRRGARGSRGVRAVGAALCVAALTVAAAGCSDDGDSPSSAASKAASAASSAASRGAGVVASATAEAQQKFNDFKDGVDAKGDVKLGDVKSDGDRTTVPVTVSNSASDTKSYVVQVGFRNGDDKLVDTVVLNVNDVRGGDSKDATARSTHSLDGDITAEVSRALRH